MQKHYYLIYFQYLGFRYHGWLKQPGVKTVEFMMEKTLDFILGHNDYKILGSSRTDSKVSANESAFELFISQKLDTPNFLSELNENLPGDIKALKIQEVDRKFNIINSPRFKEYLYLFAFGEKSHPFCAPMLCTFQNDLDIELMKKGADLYQGKYNFIKYCTKPRPGAVFEREIILSRIEENNEYKASFFPKKSYLYRIRSEGFMRYQVRLIMGQLLSLGRGEINLKDIVDSLKGMDNKPLRHIAPASGLILNQIEFQQQ